MNSFLIVGASLSAIAAFIHFSCVFLGPPGFRFLGAGDYIVKLAENGHWYPNFITILIGTVLSIWSLFALSGAGAIVRLPFAREALLLISSIYILRAVTYPLLKPAFPGNSEAFWLTTSGICLIIGVVHFIGLRQVWYKLG